MFYHHVLAWKACYTYFSAVLFKPTSRTSRIVSINSPSGEGGGQLIKGYLEDGVQWFPLILLQAKAGGVRDSLDKLEEDVMGFH